MYFAISVFCSVTFAILNHYFFEICHTAFPLTYSIIGLPIIGVIFGGLAFFDPKSGCVMVMVKIGIVCVNLAQGGIAVISLVGLGVFNCG